MTALIVAAVIALTVTGLWTLAVGAADLRRRGPIRLDPATVDRLRQQADGRRRTDRGWDEAKP